MSNSKPIPILRIITTHGLKGELKALPLTNDFSLIPKIKNFFINPDLSSPLEVESIRPGPGEGIFLIKFKNISFAEAQNLLHRLLYIPTSELPSPEEEEIYLYQLEGLRVEDKEGFFLGKVSLVIPTLDYFLLLVKGKEYEFYLPLVEEYVEELNLTEGKILVKEVEFLKALQTQGKDTEKRKS